jgi:[acyl-carrier-protein] S-malonyltransferase
MAAILALDLAAVEEACRRAAQGRVVAPANINSPGQVVIAGHADAVKRAMEACQAAGARRAVLLPVSAPFHCALMEPAQERMAADLSRIPSAIRRSRWSTTSTRGWCARRRMCRGRPRAPGVAPVRWQQSVEAMVKDGVTAFVRSARHGPHRPHQEDQQGTEVLNAEDPASLDRAAMALAGVSRTEA